jgi:hypothetical protein
VAGVALIVAAGGTLQSGAAAPGSDSLDVVDRAAASGGGLASIRDRLDSLQRRLRGYERTMARMDEWFRCIHHVPVDLVGDPDHRWGFHYDERDGTGLDTRTALTVHAAHRRPHLVLLRLTRTKGCLSRPTDPNGTGEDARPAPGRTVAGQGRLPTIGALELRLRRLERRIGRVESGTERFDEWESCLSWLPVTEYGHADQNLGYLVDDPDAGPTTDVPDRYLPALDVDTSEWDDPDYEVLAFLGRDRPFTNRECGNEPGEGTDRLTPKALDSDPYPERLEHLRHGVRDAAEDIEDLLEPVLEFVQFDECMFTLGVQNRHGYRYRTPSGADTHRSALSFDMTGLQLPDFDVMAFPGEEPPQIECNEDAGGENTDE